MDYPTMPHDLNVWTALVAFATAAGLLTIIPGLDTMLVLRTAIAEGRRRAMGAGFGICAGCLSWGLLVSVGLGAILTVSTFAYSVLRLIGACYLVYLGARLLVHRQPLPSGRIETADNPHRSDGGTFSWFVRGFLTNLLNPKVGVFYVTFLPQFVPSGVNVVGFSVLLALIHGAEGVLWFAAITLSAQSFMHWLRQPRILTWLNRVTGGAFVFFGVRLAFEQRR
jgi:threonine/homoserine/homoserine lactone efflux protein